MADLGNVMLALFERAALMETTGPTLPISWPEPPEAFIPPADGKFLEVRLMTNRPAWGGLSAGLMDQGLLQVTVVWPKNQGAVAPSGVADLVIAHFPKGAAYYAGGQKVSITADPWKAGPLPEDARVCIPVTIPWKA